jgi:pimeloyl-ACP methyl ester carboxylesterase
LSASDSAVLHLNSVFPSGDGKVLHFAVANGFPPAVYQPLFGALSAKPLSSIPWFCVLPPALQTPQPDPSRFVSWEQLAEDLIRVAGERGWRKILGVGHSFGAVAAVIAACKRPELFERIFLLDPTVFSRSRYRKVALVRLLARAGFNLSIPVVEGALRRRRKFSSRDEAISSLSGRRLFAGWPRESLIAYVDGAFRNSEGASDVELVWSAEWEAQFYRTLETRSWRWLARVPKHLRVDIIRGGHSDTLLPEVLAGMRRQATRLQQNFHFHEIRGHGHLFPLSAPSETGRLLLELMRQ